MKKGLMILCLLVAALAILPGRALVAQPYSDSKAFTPNPKLGALLEKEGFAFGLTKDEYRELYDLREDRKDKRILYAHINDIEYPMNKGFYHVAVSEEQTQIIKCISREPDSFNIATVQDDFKKKYGNNYQRLLYKGRYLLFKVNRRDCNHSCQPCLTFEVVDITNHINKKLHAQPTTGKLTNNPR